MKVILLAVLVMMLPAFGPVAAIEDVVWVSDLENNPELIGKEIVLEGRFQGRIGAGLDQVRLKNCNPDRIEFRLEDKDPKFPSSLQFIRLNGPLTRVGGKLVMQVKSWSKISTTDEQRFSDVARRLGPSDYRAWYELASRTQRLADFYGEKELKALAEEARVRGFRAEETALRPSQFAELLKLAGRATDVGLDAEESRRMQHKALRWRLDALASAAPTSGQWYELAETIAQLLPGAKTPLTQADSALVGQYRMKPIEAYDTMPKARNTFDREIWVDVTARAMSAQAAEPGTDLSNVAKQAAKLLPERSELGRQLLRQWAEAEAARAAATTLPASQVRRLADTFRVELGDPKRSQEILRQWLDARRKRLGARDADGRVRLAKDFRADLKDNDTAGKLLLEALQIESDLPEAAAELKALGYVKTSSGWKSAVDLPSAASAPTPSSRQPEKDMTPDQVRSIMGDPRPSDRIRFAYRKDGRFQVIEQWTYRGPPDLYVAFQIMSDGESRVIAINTPPQK